MALACAFVSALHGQTGPGGVGSETDNRFWYQANSLFLSDGVAVSSWTNNGGNAEAATQGTGSRQPTFQSDASSTINGYPVVRFDGTDDYLAIANNSQLNSGTTTVRTFYVVIRTGADVTSRQVVYEEGGAIRGLNIYIFNGALYLGAWNLNNDGAGSPWGYLSANTAVAANTTYVIGMVKNGNGTTTGTIEGYLNGNNFGTINNIGTLYGHTGAIGIGAKNNDTYYETGASSGTGEYFGGDVAEFIHYNRAVNFAEKSVIENYLAAKYGVALSSGDLYTMDNPGNGDYDHEVAGIGQFSASENNTSGRGASAWEVSGASGLQDSEYLIWGHDNGSSAVTTSGVPASIEYRMTRVWRASESGEVGNVTLQFDENVISTIGAAVGDFFLLIDPADADFSDVTPVVASSYASGVVTFSNVDLDDGYYFTLGINQRVLGHTGPGGVGDDVQNRFWVDGEDLEDVYLNGGLVQTWSNKGGNTEDVYQNTGGNRPTYQTDATTLNAQPVVRFNGSSTRLIINDNTDLNTSASAQIGKTFFMAFRTGANVTSRQVLFEEGGGTRGTNMYIFNGQVYLGGWNVNNDGVGSPWGFLSVNAAVSANTDYVLTYVLDGNAVSTGEIRGFLNGVSMGTASGIGLLYAHADDIGMGSANGSTHYETGTSSNANYFQGDIGEFIHYNEAILDGEVQIVENYLSAKYGITLGANDHYTMDNNGNGDFDHDVTGIGRDAGGRVHAAAQGEGRVRISNAASIANGDFLFLGHNGTSLCSSTNVPGGVTNRYERLWRVSEPSGDLGNVDLTFDFTGAIASGTLADVRLLVDGDTDFSNATVVGISGTSGNEVTFSVNLANAQYFTVAINGSFNDFELETTQWNGGTNTSWDNLSNWSNGLPTAKKDVIISSAASNMPALSGVASCKNMTIQASATLTVSGTDTLRVFGNWTNNGAFTYNQSTVKLFGYCGSSNVISGNAPHAFYHLDLVNTDGASISGRRADVHGGLTLTNGLLQTNDSLRIVSDASGTGRVNEISGGSIAGNVEVQRYIDAGQTHWRFFSYPISGGDLEQLDDDFETSGIPGTDYPDWPSVDDRFESIYFYDEDEGTTYQEGFEVPSSTSEVVNAGQGVWVWCGDALAGTGAFTVDFFGPINTGDVNFNVTYDPAAGNTVDDGWNMVGNPYPCTIDWDAAGWTKSGLANALYIWDPDNKVFASYVGGTGTNGGSRYIASGQGFFVQTNAGSPSLIVRENCKVNQDQAFIRRGVEETIRFRLYTGERYDETVIRFAPEASLGYDDALDARKFKVSGSGSTALLLTSTGGEKFGINTLPELEGMYELKLFVDAVETGEYTLDLTDASLLDQFSCVVLKDLRTDEVVDLSQPYSFTHTSFDKNARFSLALVKAQTVGVTHVSCFGEANGAVEIESNHLLSDYTWLNSEGEVVSEEIQVISSSLSNLKAGAYQVHVQVGVVDCPVQIQEVAVYEPEALVVDLVLEHTYCEDCCEGSIEWTVSGGVGNYEVFWENEWTSNSRLELVCGGVYPVQFRDANGCMMQEDIEILDESLAVGIEESKHETIYLNQRGSKVYVPAEFVREFDQFLLYDLQGKTVLSGSVGPELDVLGVNTGIYFIQLTNGEQSIQQRILLP